MRIKLALILLTMSSISFASSTGSAIQGISNQLSPLRIFATKEGSIAYEDSMGDGPVVLCIPGMGDTRGQFRLLSPLLRAKGYRVIVVDPRGQGDSDATFNSYSASAVGDDLIQLIDHLGVEVFLVGNSSGGASASWVAINRPHKVKGIIYLDAFLRDHPMGFFTRLMLEGAIRGPWAGSFWVSYYKSLFISNPPLDQNQYLESLKTSLNLEGHISALRQIMFSSKSDVESRLKEIKVPILAIAGSKDPDFEKPDDELSWIVSTVPGEKVIIDGAGHYPHLEYPDQISNLVQTFISSHRGN